MALPYQFYNATNPTGAQLDSDLAALGNLTPIPCVAAGTNTINLTPIANTPTISAYATGMQFTAVAASTNTGASTGKVGSLATSSIYKNSANGPIPLSGGEIVASVAFTLMYDSALNGGSGGFHLMIAPVISPSGGSVSGPITGQGSLATISFPAAVLPLLSGVTLASISRLSLGTGQTISRVFSASASIAFSALNPQTASETSIALAGCSVGDSVMLGYPSSIASQIMYRGYVNNAGTVAVVAANYSSSTITPTPGTYRVTTFGF